VNLLKRVKVAAIWRREYHRVKSELDTYSDHELRDLRLTRSDTAEIAAEAAAQHVAIFIRSRSEYREAGQVMKVARPATGLV
jgi:uncharacterized protein YjiS (DUF1127 family)